MTLKLGFRKRLLCECITLISMIILIFVITRFRGHEQDIIMIDGGLKNPENNHPLLPNTIQNVALLSSALVVYLLLLAWRALDSENRWFGIGTMAREIVWSYSLAGLVTNCAKIYVGRPRPNFFEYCDWNGTECTDNTVNAYRSFPSGHATSAMSTFGLMSIHFIENVLLQLRGYKLPSDRLDSSCYGWLWNLFLPITVVIGPPTILIALLPGFFAFFVACSRIHDYWHFAADALAGALIGLSSALLSFSMFRKPIMEDSSSMAIEDVEVSLTKPPT